MKKLIIIALVFIACETSEIVSHNETKTTTFTWNVDYPYNDSLSLGGINVKVWKLRLIVNGDTTEYPDNYTTEICDTVSYTVNFYFDHLDNNEYSWGESYREYDSIDPGEKIQITQIY